MKHILKSDQVVEFLKNSGIKICKSKSCHNAITLKNINTNDTIELWADSDNSIAGGVPGIYVGRTIQ